MAGRRPPVPQPWPARIRASPPACCPPPEPPGRTCSGISTAVLLAAAVHHLPLSALLPVTGVHRSPAAGLHEGGQRRSFAGISCSPRDPFHSQQVGHAVLASLAAKGLTCQDRLTCGQNTHPQLPGLRFPPQRGETPRGQPTR